MAETTSRCILLDEGPPGPELTRSKLLSKSKALLAARSVLRSYLGSAVMYNITREMNVYQLQLCRLQSETIQRLRSLEQSRTQFMMQHCRLPVVADWPRCRRAVWTAAGDHWRRTAPVNRDLDGPGPGYVKPTPRSAHSAPIKPASNAFRRLTTRTVFSSPSAVMSRKEARSSSDRFQSTCDVLSTLPAKRGRSVRAIPTSTTTSEDHRKVCLPSAMKVWSGAILNLPLSSPPAMTIRETTAKDKEKV